MEELLFIKYNNHLYSRATLIHENGRMVFKIDCFNVREGEVKYTFTEITEGHPILKDFNLPFDKKVFDALVIFLKTTFNTIDFVRPPILLAIDNDVGTQDFFNQINGIYPLFIPSEAYYNRLKAIDKSKIDELLNNLWIADRWTSEGWRIVQFQGRLHSILGDASEYDYRRQIERANFSIRQLPETDGMYRLIESVSNQARKRFQQQVLSVHQITHHQRSSVQGENKYLVWHGTPAFRVLDILQNGFQLNIRQGGARGFYFSDSPEVSINYADATRVNDLYGKSLKTYNGRVISFVFLAEVTLGRFISPPDGYNEYGATQEEVNEILQRNKADSFLGDISLYKATEYVDINGARFATKFESESGYIGMDGLGREFVTFDPNRISIKYLVAFISDVGVGNDF
jgi:hypothetical protein